MGTLRTTQRTGYTGFTQLRRKKAMMQGYTRTERFLSLFTTLRPGEGSSAIRLCFVSFVIMFAYYMLKVIREPLILAEGSAELKAYSTAIQAGLLIFIVPLFAHLYQRLGSRSEKHHLLHNTLLFFIINLFGFVLAYRAGWQIGMVFYVWLGIFSVMILALLWGFAADLYNVKSGQRIFPLIAAASALGALVGSGMASRLDQLFGHGGVMFNAGLLLLVPLWLSRKVERHIPAGSSAAGNGSPAIMSSPWLEGFKVVLDNSYLRLIAVFVILINLVNTNGEYILASFVTNTLSGHEQITRFYSGYLFMTTLFSFLIQLLLVSRIYKYLGIGRSLYILPLLMAASYSLIALVPMLWVARTMLVAENSVNYSLQSTTRHALFLPVNREQKYVGKHTIDTFFFRVGDVLSGSFVYLASTVLMVGIGGFVLANIALSLVLLAVSHAIAHHHRHQVKRNLSNQPPIVTRELQDLEIPAGKVSMLQLGADTFVDPDVGDALKYQAYTADQERLPSWIKFDSFSRKFQFNPPRASSGSVTIRVVARDFDGLEAEVCFTLSYGA
jgi:ATP:ADP antiporter, AAA family